MELPPRPPGDQLLPSGELTDIRRRLRSIASRHDLVSVIACAFDHRTRMLPFCFADRRMAPAGPRAIGASMLDSGFDKTRIVLQQWNPRFRPSQMRLDGRIPDLLLISSMSLHTARCKAMIRDIGQLPADRRPLVIVGGSLCVYEPWEVFYSGVRPGDPADTASADVAVTGEEYVLLNLLEVLLSGRAASSAAKEPLRQTFLRARDSGALDAIPGLVYPRTDAAGRPVELVDTGVQRLLGDLDEQPMPAAGYSILEAPSRGSTLAAAPLSADQVRRHSRIGSLVMTFGCKFTCEYCPIPAYNQRNLRGKSGQRVAEEMRLIYSQYGIRHFFGTDDNLFSNRERALDIVTAIAALEHNGQPLHKKLRWGNEVTIHDTLAMREHLPLIHRGGVRALWVGVEDMTGALVKKGQSVDKTVEAFELLRKNSICPMPMMMHHDTQPLLSRGNNSGLLNQVNLLRKAGAVSLQVLMLTPSAGSKVYNQTFRSGLVYQSVGSRRVEPHMYDGNHVIACGAKSPWRKQLNILLTYMFFYNPVRMIAAMTRLKGPLSFKPFGMQIIGMFGLLMTIRRTWTWMLRLMVCKIARATQPPESPLPMRSPEGLAASHGSQRDQWVPSCLQPADSLEQESSSK